MLIILFCLLQDMKDNDSIKAVRLLKPNSLLQIFNASAQTIYRCSWLMQKKETLILNEKALMKSSF